MRLLEVGGPNGITEHSSLPLESYKFSLKLFFKNFVVKSRKFLSKLTLI